MEDRIFAAGGNHIPSHWDDFADQTGINAILHLRSGRPNRFLGSPPVSFLWIESAAEDKVGVEARWLAGRFIQGCLDRGQRVLLHSGEGRNRTRWAFVAYLICSGKAVRAALRAAEAKPWTSPYRTQVDTWQALDEFARTRPGELAREVPAPP